MAFYKDKHGQKMIAIEALTKSDIAGCIPDRTEVMRIGAESCLKKAKPF